ncbi:Iron transport multicopper oxidase FET3 [Hondaea fermentalgiana]|uniref:Iron transport multicopper oxidase FET3 n=1 Tax=Hondaea fermentalgiana TaxID=2315210 RepID=A0A2R5G346_9STRA|nr:Iron transport multicopper oxidase FET3 [Hondaea fermentalgiana]|eukprot:GBG25456.1 Iron transport multicopper oxidase FET3 [Hondaea fermentalgiana]
MLSVVLVAFLVQAVRAQTTANCNSNEEGILLSDCPLSEVVLGDGDSMDLSFGTSVLELPFLVESTDGTTRTISHEGSFTMHGKGYGANGAARTAPGPIIRMAKGAKVTVRYTNDLDPPSPGNHTSNIHTHGLHVSGDEDDVALKIPPGESHDYVYTLPTDHAGGSHWYHPHMHPLAVAFTGAGAAGMLIIDDADDGTEIPTELLDTPEQVIFVQHVDPPRLLDLSDGVEDDPFSHRIGVKDTTFAVNVSGLGFDSATDAFANFKSDGIFLINGLYKPRLEVEQGIWYRWRIAHVAAVRDLKMAIYNASAATPSNCEVRVIARDGVYLRDGPRDLNFAANHSIHLHPANRADVLVRCSGEPGTQALVYDNFDAFDEEGLVDDSRQDPVYQREFLFTISVISATQTSALPDTAFSWQACLPFYLADLLDREPSPYSGFTLAEVQEASATIARPDFEERWKSPDFLQWVILVNPFSVNNVEFAKDWITADEALPEQRNVSVMRLGEVQEWELTESSHNHPLHIHVNHYQLLHDIEDETGFHKRGDWLDTVRPRTGAAVSFRFQPDTFLGRVALHCHNMEHSDEGAKAQAYIIENPNLSDSRVPSLTRPWADICGSEVALETPTSSGTTPTPSPTASPVETSIKVTINNVADVTYSHAGIVLSTRVVQARADTPVEYCWTRREGQFTDDVEAEIGELVERSSCELSAAEIEKVNEVYATSPLSPNLAIKPYAVPAVSTGKVSFRYELVAKQANASSYTNEIGFRVYGFPAAPSVVVSSSQGTAGVTRFTLTAIPADDAENTDVFEYKFALERNTLGAEPVSISEWSSSPTLSNVVLPFTQKTETVSYTSVVAFVRDGYGAESPASDPVFIRLSVPSSIDEVTVASKVDDEDPDESLRDQLAYSSVLTRALESLSDEGVDTLKSQITTQLEGALTLLHERTFSSQLGELIMLVLLEIALSLDDDDIALAERVAEMFQTTLSLWRNEITRVVEVASAANVEPNLAFSVPEGAMGIASEVLAELASLSGICQYNFSLTDLHSDIIETVLAPRLSGQGSFVVSFSGMDSLSYKEFSNGVSGRYQPASSSTDAGKNYTFVEISSELFDPGPSAVYDEVIVSVLRSPPEEICVNGNTVNAIVTKLANIDIKASELGRNLASTERAQQTTAYQQNVVTDVLSLELQHSSVIFASSSRRVNLSLDILYADASSTSAISCSMWDSTGEVWDSDACAVINRTSDIITCECGPITSRSQFAGIQLSEVVDSGLPFDPALLGIILGATIGAWLFLSMWLHTQDVRDANRVQRGAVLAFLAQRHFGKNVRSLEFMKRDAFQKLRAHAQPPMNPTKSFSDLLGDVANAHSVAGLLVFDPQRSRIARSVVVPLAMLAAFASVYMVNKLGDQFEEQSLTLVGFIVGALVVATVILVYRYALYKLAQSERRVLGRVAHLKAQAIAIVDSPWHNSGQVRKRKKRRKNRSADKAWRNPNQHRIEDTELVDLERNISRTANPELEQLRKRQMQVFIKRGQLIFMKAMHDHIMRSKYYRLAKNIASSVWFFRLFNDGLRRIYGGKVHISVALARHERGLARLEKAYHVRPRRCNLPRLLCALLMLGLFAACTYLVAIGTKDISTPRSWALHAVIAFGVGVVIVEPLVLFFVAFALFPRHTREKIPLISRNRGSHFSWDSRISTRSLEMEPISGREPSFRQNSQRSLGGGIQGRRGDWARHQDPSASSLHFSVASDLDNKAGEAFGMQQKQGQQQGQQQQRRRQQREQPRPQSKLSSRRRGSTLSAATGFTGILSKFMTNTVNTDEEGTEYYDEDEDEDEVDDGYETTGTDTTLHQSKSFFGAKSSAPSDSHTTFNTARTPRRRRGSTLSSMLFKRKDARSVFDNDEDEDDPDFRHDDLDFV